MEIKANFNFQYPNYEIIDILNLKHFPFEKGKGKYAFAFRRQCFVSLESVSCKKPDFLEKSGCSVKVRSQNQT